MKFTITALFLIAQITGGMAAAVSVDAAECGELGLLEVHNLPSGVDHTQLRKCAGHPMGRDRDLPNASLVYWTDEQREKAQNAPKLDARSVVATLSGRGANACWNGASTGCSKGYCWKTCGSNGEWCWTAANGGAGDWLKCSNGNECTDGSACGQGCFQSKACGCSC
ncbi:hypothetical protein TWF694_009618 [Orbilia ellipsospora]|uniref:IDI-2 n=1 Tax=Orbilia ellipsospora TaxID=2528407 RepID=A0AAV9XBD3_9PEZI